MNPSSDYVIVIPARQASERLPGKMLRPIGGKPMIQWVWEAAQRAGAAEVVVATDDETIAETVRAFGGEAEMTRLDHTSGSDRIAECAERRGWSDDQLVVNLQGDEPEMPAEVLEQVADLLRSAPEAAVASLYWPITDANEVRDPNAVKVVVSEQGRALYFSRAVMPHPRGRESVEAALAAGIPWRRHLGLYAYRLGALRDFTTWTPGVLEQTEKLEQLRFLENGREIRIEQACTHIPPGVDTEQDLERARASLSG